MDCHFRDLPDFQSSEARLIMGANPGVGGGRGDVSPPHVFSGGRHNIKCPPPPHVFQVGGRMNFGRYNVVFCVFLVVFFCLFPPFFFFFFFLLVRKCGLGTPTHFDLRDFRRRWRSGKKSVGVPPPPFFLPISPFFFLFFFLVRNVRDVGWVPLHILTCATFDADGAPENTF